MPRESPSIAKRPFQISPWAWENHVRQGIEFIAGHHDDSVLISISRFQRLDREKTVGAGPEA